MNCAQWPVDRLIHHLHCFVSEISRHHLGIRQRHLIGRDLCLITVSIPTHKNHAAAYVVMGNNGTRVKVASYMAGLRKPKPSIRIGAAASSP